MRLFWARAAILGARRGTSRVCLCQRAVGHERGRGQAHWRASFVGGHLNGPTFKSMGLKAHFGQSAWAACWRRARSVCAPAKGRRMPLGAYHRLAIDQYRSAGRGLSLQPMPAGTRTTAEQASSVSGWKPRTWPGSGAAQSHCSNSHSYSHANSHAYSQSPIGMATA